MWIFINTISAESYHLSFDENALTTSKLITLIRDLRRQRVMENRLHIDEPSEYKLCNKIISTFKQKFQSMTYGEREEYLKEKGFKFNSSDKKTF